MNWQARQHNQHTSRWNCGLCELWCKWLVHKYVRTNVLICMHGYQSRYLAESPVWIRKSPHSPTLCLTRKEYLIPMYKRTHGHMMQDIPLYFSGKSSMWCINVSKEQVQSYGIHLKNSFNVYFHNQCCSSSLVYFSPRVPGPQSTVLEAVSRSSCLFPLQTTILFSRAMPKISFTFQAGICSKYSGKIFFFSLLLYTMREAERRGGRKLVSGLARELDSQRNQLWRDLSSLS